MSEAYHYKAFISYRHHDQDKRMAEKLQRRLENYKPPKGVGSGEKWKVFRDVTELSTNANLSVKIKEALASSEYLIVVCSESLKESRWCLEEITHFKELHNGSTEKIIPFVVSGDPDKVFPEAILTTAVINPETGETEQKLVEPLAANIAAATPRESEKRFKTEFFRIAAPMLSTSYDSLYHRERKRKRRKRRIIAASVAAAVLLFSIYSTAMMMKISSQNRDLELKNTALTNKTNELNLSNANLNQANLKLDKANADLVLTNSELDSSNAQLTAANTKLDSANNKLIAANADLDSANAQLTAANDDLDKSNKDLAAKTEEALANYNEAKLQEQNAKDNLELAESNYQEAERQRQIAEDNYTEATQQRKRAEDNYEEAERQRQIAVEQKQEADTQRQIAVEQKQEADAQRQIAVEQKQEADAQRQIAVEQKQEADAQRQNAVEQKQEADRQRQIAEDKNEKLMQANAELTAKIADSQFSDDYDRLGAIDTLFSTPLYKDDPYALKPSAQLFLNKALYSFSSDTTPRLQRTLDAESYIEDFCFSPDLKHILAYDTLNYVYVFDVQTGDTVYKKQQSYVCAIRYLKNDRICVVTSTDIICTDVSSGNTVWALAVKEISKNQSMFIQQTAFSIDGKRLAVWDNDSTYLFIDTESGLNYYTYRLKNAGTGFKGGTTNDFSDGIHLYSVSNNNENEWYTVIDTEKRQRSIRFIKNDRILAVHHAENVGSVTVKLVRTKLNHTVLDKYNKNGNYVKSLPLSPSALTDAAVKSVFTTEEGIVYAVVSATDIASKQPMLYLADLTNDKVTSLALSSSAAQSNYAGNGWLSVFTSQGAEYSYRIDDGLCMLTSLLADSAELHADGTKMLWRASEDLGAALGKNSTRIMIYQGKYGDDSISITECRDLADQILETESYLVCETADELLVYSKTDKSFVKGIAKAYSASQIKALYGDKAAIIDKKNSVLHIIDLANGKDETLCLDEYSSANHWNLMTDSSGKRIVLADTDVLVLIDGSKKEQINIAEDIASDAYYGLTALSPDGKKLITVSAKGMDGLVYRLFDLESNTNDPLELMDVNEEQIALLRHRIVFSPDSKKLAIAESGFLYLFDAYTGQIETKTALNDAVHSLVFNGNSLLSMTENYSLDEYALPSLNHSRSLRLPANIISDDLDSKQVLLNPQRNELVIFNSGYACFIDLESFELVAQTADTEIDILGFLISTQELAIQSVSGQPELKLYRHYTIKDISDKARTLISD